MNQQQKEERTVLSYLQVQDGQTLAEIHTKLHEIGIPFPEPDLRATLTRLAERGQVVWSGRVWLEKRTAAARLEQAA